MNYLQNILWHLLTALPACLYGNVMRFRNHLYNIGSKAEIHFELPIISVGNLAVGGTGKTPLTEYLIRLLISSHKKVAVLSRGYGRQTKGFRLADTAATAATIGDEPMQYFTKFGDQIVIAVGEDRVAAVPEILLHHPETEIIILDDAYQHRKIARRLNLLLTEYDYPFYQDFVMPRGRLREPRIGAVRADAVVVTKCPTSISAAEISQIKNNIRRYTRPETPIFFTTVFYQTPEVFYGAVTNLNAETNVILASGIARPQMWEAAMQQRFRVVDMFRFTDHYHYTRGDVLTFDRACAKHNAVFLCTEKDMVKLKPLLADAQANFSAFFQPITIGFLADEVTFQQLILSLTR
ncbi:MAG: tetraacyldisaccharide 4'-kinase [Cytophagales bacterium]|nr:tetraacyldisaccharide 4'-kinase [Bernardetiaceae bacterium]MDW8205969.1 tetraacyldisaccharide 4'-kinase [Cytophagales bacterium]